MQERKQTTAALFCVTLNTLTLSLLSLSVCVQMLSIFIAALYMDRSNRKAFIQKKLLQVSVDGLSHSHKSYHHPDFLPLFLSTSQVLTKQREETLVQKKEEQEALI